MEVRDISGSLPGRHAPLSHRPVRARRSFSQGTLISILALLLATVVLTASNLHSSGHPSSPVSMGSPPAAQTASMNPQHVNSPQVSGCVQALSLEVYCIPPTGGPAASAISAWHNLTSPVQPPARSQASLAYDPSTADLVLFGGQNGVGAALNDTWIYANNAWTDVSNTSGSAPSPRYGASLVFDSADGYLLLVGGFGLQPGCSPECTDIWTFASGAWTHLRTSLPLGGQYNVGMSAAFDSSAGYVLIEAWSANGNSTAGESLAYANGTVTNLSFDPSTQTNRPAPGYSNPAMVDDPADSGVLLYGGTWHGTSSRVAIPSNSTWLFLKGNWTNESENSTHVPSPRWSPAMTSDTTTGAVLMFGGFETRSNYPYFAAVNDTWIFLNGSWSNATAGPSPDSMAGAALAWDPALRDAVLLDVAANGQGTTWAWTASPAITGLQLAWSPVQPEAGLPVEFSATIDGGTPNFAYAWDFGDGRLASIATPTHTYVLSGTFIVTLTVVDAQNFTASSNTTITVLPALAVIADSSAKSTDVGVPISLAAVVSGGIEPVTLLWSFGDGTNSSARAPSHDYLLAGIYRVSVSATDTAGAKSVGNLSLIVNPPLSPVTITATPSSPDLGQLVNFSASETGGTSPYTFAWDFGDGGIGGNLSEISHVFTTTGPFTASVTVTDTAGDREVGSTNLAIALNLSIHGSWSLGAAPLPIAFSSSVTGGLPGYSFQWTFGDGQSSEASNPTHIFAYPGFYESSLRVTDQRGSSIQTVWQVYAAPGGGSGLAVALQASPARISIGSSVIVTASPSGGQGGYSLTWESGTLGCSSAGLLEIRCSPSMGGSYPISLILEDNNHSTAVGATTLFVGNQTGSGEPTGVAKSPNAWTAAFENRWFTTILVTLAVGGVIAAVIAVRLRASPVPPSDSSSQLQLREVASNQTARPRRVLDPSSDKLSRGQDSEDSLGDLL
jgi:PKD repeat protein